jgi:Putative auto-transporter adhesin, head GIN domain
MAIVSAPQREQQTAHGAKLWVAALIILVVLAVGAVLLVRNLLPNSSRSSRVTGSGIAATSTRALASFSGIELAGSNNVTVVVAARQSVVVHGDGNLLSRVTTDVREGKLVIGNVGSFTTRSAMYVQVSAPSLTALDLTGSGTITVAGMTAAGLTVTLSGSGDIQATGSVIRLNVSIHGSGDAQLSGLVARNVDAVVSGSGAIFVTATQSLDAKVPGSGVVVYRGNPPQVSSSITGSGAVTPG